MSSRAIALSLACTLCLLGSKQVQAQMTVPEVQTSSPEAVPLREAVGSELPSPSPYQADTTLLKPGDRIQITVVGFPDLSGPQTVLADGTVQLPMAGHVGVWGLTPDQVVAQVSQALLPYVRRPQVGITLLNIRPPRVSVTGEVRRPGLHQLIPADNPDPAEATASSEGVQTVSYALSLAGGVTPNADLRNITIRRLQRGQATMTRSGEPARNEIKVNLWEAIQDGNLSSDLLVYDGDEIVVPTAVAVNSADQQRLLDSTVAPVTVGIQVAGEVQRPGPVDIRPSGGINAAIAAAGGPTDAADINPVYLLRMAPDGSVERQEYAFGREDSGPLRDGDIVVVKRSGSRTFLDTLGRVLSPLGFFFRLFD